MSDESNSNSNLNTPPTFPQDQPMTIWGSRVVAVQQNGKSNSIYVGVKGWIDPVSGDIDTTALYSVKTDCMVDFNPDTEHDFMLTSRDLKALAFNVNDELVAGAKKIVDHLMPIAQDKKKLTELKSMSRLYTYAGKN